MRTGEILKALMAEYPGISIRGDRHLVRCRTLYEPHISCFGPTAFEAAFMVAKLLSEHPNCPESVMTALKEYEQQTHRLI